MIAVPIDHRDGYFLCRHIKGRTGVVAKLEFSLSPIGLSYRLNLGGAVSIEAVHQQDGDPDFGGLTIAIS